MPSPIVSFARASARLDVPVLARLGIGQVDDVVGGVLRRQEDAEHAALPLDSTAGTLSIGVFSPCG